jgi:hypothetical protein
MVNLPQNIDPIKAGKIAVTIIIIVLVLVILWKIYRWANPKNTGIDTIKPPNQDKLTYTPNQYQAFADTIEQAVSHSNDDEDAIYGVFRNLKKLEDLQQLIFIYGDRKYVPPYGFIWQKGNLIQTLHAKLSGSEIEKINTILSDNGINFKI